MLTVSFSIREDISDLKHHQANGESLSQSVVEPNTKREIRSSTDGRKKKRDRYRTSSAPFPSLTLFNTDPFSIEFEAQTIPGNPKDIEHNFIEEFEIGFVWI